MNKYVHENNKRTSTVCPWHTDHAWCITAVLHDPCKHMINMTQWACHEGPESDLRPFSLTASHEESHTVDERAELLSVSYWLDAISDSCWTLVKRARPSRRFLSPDTSWQLSVALRLLCYGWAAHTFSKKQVITLFDTKWNFGSFSMAGHSTELYI